MAEFSVTTWCYGSPIYANLMYANQYMLGGFHGLIGFTVSRYHGFMVSWFHRFHGFRGFMVSWFHRFHGFMVS